MNQSEKQILNKIEHSNHYDMNQMSWIEYGWNRGRLFILKDIIEALKIAESRKETGDYKKIIKWIENHYELNK